MIPYLMFFIYWIWHINFLSCPDPFRYQRNLESNTLYANLSNKRICSTIVWSNPGYTLVKTTENLLMSLKDPDALQYPHTLIGSRPSDNPAMNNFDHLVLSHLGHYLSSRKLYINGDGYIEPPIKLSCRTFTAFPKNRIYN